MEAVRQTVWIVTEEDGAESFTMIRAVCFSEKAANMWQNANEGYPRYYEVSRYEIEDDGTAELY
ncbi:hypothetical protein [Streptomyces sp. NPDC055085]